MTRALLEFQLDNRAARVRALVLDGGAAYVSQRTMRRVSLELQDAPWPDETTLTDDSGGGWRWEYAAPEQGDYSVVAWVDSKGNNKVED